MPIISSFSNQFKPIGGNLVVVNDLILPPSNDFTYVLIPNNDLTYTLIPSNDLNYIEIPNNDILYGFIPDNDINYVTIPNNDVAYTLIPNPDSTYTLIPNNDIEYSVLKPGNSFYGQITLGEDSVEGTCDCPENMCPRFYVTGDGPTFCESNNFITNGNGFGFNGWGTIVYNGFYKTVNMDGSNIATYRTDCGTCPITPTPTPTPTSTPTETPTPTPTETPTPTDTPTPTPTPTPTDTPTPTPTPTPTETPTLYLNCYTVRQYLYGYSGGGASTLYILGTDYPNVGNIPVGATATINGTSVAITHNVFDNTAAYFQGGSGYRINVTPNVGNISAGTYVEFCWYSTTPPPTATPTPTPTPTPTATPIPPTATPTPTPTLEPLNFTISSNCSNNGTIVISNFVGVASGQYRYSTGVYTTENDALNSTGYNFISSGSSGIVTIGSSGTYWVMVADWNNPSYKIAKSVTISCVTPMPTPTPTPSSKSWNITQCGDPCDTGVCACNSQSTITVYTLQSVTNLVTTGITVYSDSSLTTTWNGYYYNPDSDEVWKFVNGVSSVQNSCAIGVDPCIV